MKTTTPTIEKMKKQFRQLWGSYDKHTDTEGLDVKIERLLTSAYQQGKEEAIQDFRIILQDVKVTDWLRNTYGLYDDDTLNAGGVEDLLQQFVYDHSSLSQPKEEKEECPCCCHYGCSHEGDSGFKECSHCQKLQEQEHSNLKERVG